MVVHAPTRIYEPGLGLFSETDLDALERACDALPLTKAYLNSASATPAYDDAVRITQYASILRSGDFVWFYQRLTEIIQAMNASSFRFDLRGYSEPPTFMVYRDSEGGHFDWHFDTGPLPARKLSVTIQLTDPARYQGGDLQFSLGTRIVAAPRVRGAVVIFPSYMIHRVTPVTAGVRKSIVAWVTGPDFK